MPSKRELTACQKAERSIQKTYRDRLWTPFIHALKTYDLLQEGDKVAVCISGGKDSMLLAKLMQMLQHISDFPFDLVYLVMDPGYAPENRKKIEYNAKLLEIPITIFDSNIFNVANNTDHSPCYLCARMRRGNLYAEAKKLGCNKIALGHHMDDVIETTLIGMFYSSQMSAMMPKLRSKNFEGMELIRPLYCVREENIIKWAKYNDFSFLQCACHFTENTANGESESKRKEIKELIKKLKKDNPDIDISIFNSLHTVETDTFPGWKKDGEVHSFLENY